MLALNISSSRMQSPSIPNVITEVTDSSSSNMSLLFIDKWTDNTDDPLMIIAVVVAVNNSRY